MDKKYYPAEQLIIFRDVLKEFTTLRKEKIISKNQEVDFTDVPFPDTFNFIFNNFLYHNMVPVSSKDNRIKFDLDNDEKYKSYPRIFLTNSKNENLTIDMFNTYRSSITFQGSSYITCITNLSNYQNKFTIPVKYNINKNFADASTNKIMKEKDVNFIKSIYQELKIICDGHSSVCNNMIDYFHLDNHIYGLTLTFNFLWSKVSYVLKKNIFPIDINEQIDDKIKQVADTLNLAKKRIIFKSTEYSIDITSNQYQQNIQIEFLGLRFSHNLNDGLYKSHTFKYFVSYLLKSNKYDDFERKVLKKCISNI